MLYGVVGILTIALAVLGFEVHQNTRAIAGFRPSFVRINDLGNAQPIYLSDSVYKPQAPEVKHFLSDFVTKYYTHRKERLSDYYLSKYYLSQQLGSQSYQEDLKSEWVKKLWTGQIEQTEAQVHKVTIANLSTAPYQALVDFEKQLHRWTVSPAGTEGYEKAEVTAGGIDTNELSAKTMESRKVPGLFFIGEVVDVTGQLGGFNFQWAWSSGAAAGRAL